MQTLLLMQNYRGVQTLNKYIIRISVNTCEYEHKVKIKGMNLEQINDNCVLIDGVEICFEEDIIDIMEGECDE